MKMRFQSGVKWNVLPAAAGFLLLRLLLPAAGYTQAAAEIGAMVQRMKSDSKGPFDSIRWFCKDGSMRPARESCPGPGGYQHGYHKAAVRKLADEHGIHLGQVMAGSPFPPFWGDGFGPGRLKQYALESYLRDVDDGWIFRKARYYRGAVQLEDEAAWSRGFLLWLLERQEVIRDHFYLAREAVRALPQRAGDDRWKRIRAEAKTVSDLYPPFMDLRIKLHGRPDPPDLARVRDFRTAHQQAMTAEAGKVLTSLIGHLEAVFAPGALSALAAHVADYPADSPVRAGVASLILIGESGAPEASLARMQQSAELIWMIRQRLLLGQSGRIRLSLLDLSLDLESLLYRDLNAWIPETVKAAAAKLKIAVQAAAGCGYLEIWEYEETQGRLDLSTDNAGIPLTRFQEYAADARRMAEWGAGMVRAVYGETVEIFSRFEPLAGGFVDERIRGGILLPLGDVAGLLADGAARRTGGRSSVMGISDPERIRGLNPGFAKGELVVVQGDPDQVAYSDKKIYVLPRVPAHLRPVAGILAVTEGNAVSHVQLLARGFGIPNAVITPGHLAELMPFGGRELFYAVSPGGTVILKPAADLNPEEGALVEKAQRGETRVQIPTERLLLERDEMVPLSEARAADSGRLCGPKAANLGQLKFLFPEHVGEGLIIPFGIFHAHMAQPMPGTEGTYRAFLLETFAQAEKARQAGRPDDAINAEVLTRLDTLREAIRRIAFLPRFDRMLTTRFSEKLGAPMGELPVFIRSDTNMEDLKTFTGAGLNLTVFNVREAGKIRQAIRDVWASPFSERSYLWRQRLMLNPQDVYPSILILPTVAVDSSGVLITADIAGREAEGVTAAFSAGAGGAVEGQAAETYLIRPDGGFRLLSPSRDAIYNVVPASGGVEKARRALSTRILDPDAIAQLRGFARVVKSRMQGAPGFDSETVLDVELGFREGEIRLFQVRPYVENRRARASAYLRGLDPVVDDSATLSVTERL